MHQYLTHLTIHKFKMIPTPYCWIHSLVGKNLNYAGSKDVYIDTNFATIKENGFNENLLKEVRHDVRTLIKTQVSQFKANYH